MVRNGRLGAGTPLACATGVNANAEARATTPTAAEKNRETRSLRRVMALFYAPAGTALMRWTPHIWRGACRGLPAAGAPFGQVRTLGAQRRVVPVAGVEPGLVGQHVE